MGNIVSCSHLQYVATQIMSIAIIPQSHIYDKSMVRSKTTMSAFGRFR